VIGLKHPNRSGIILKEMTLSCIGKPVFLSWVRITNKLSGLGLDG